MVQNTTGIVMPLWPTDDELDLEDLFGEPTIEREITVPNIDPKDAINANKTRDTCIVCGQPTRDKPLFTSVIKYCPCVDKLLKGS